MDRNTSFEFASDLRRLIEASADIVWDSEERSRAHLGDWPEASFADTLLVHGLLGGHPRTQKICSRLSNSTPFSANLDYSVHPQQSMEPLTGADLAVTVNIAVDREIVQRKLVLVQLKRATIKKGEVCFPKLHYKSGKRQYGEDIHQAQKMLLFSPSSVYWLCVPSYALNDSAFLNAYSKSHNIAIRRQPEAISSFTGSTETLNQFLAFGGLNSPSVLLELIDDYPPLHYFYRHYLRKRSKNPTHIIEEWYERRMAEQKVNLLRSLKYDTKLEAWRSNNLGNRFSVVVVHALSVLSLASEGRTDLKSIIEMSTPLPQFILGDIVSDGFGDDNPSVLESMTKRAPDEYMLSKVQTYAKSKIDGDGSIPARSVMQFNVTLHSELQSRG